MLQEVQEMLFSIYKHLEHGFVVLFESHVKT
jgi:hypothetical protein